MSYLNLARIAPLDFGKGLFHSLAVSVQRDDISEDEKDLLQQIRVSLDHYYDERLALAAVAIEFSIRQDLRGTTALDEVKRGYIDQWFQFGLSGNTGKRQYELYSLRRKDYSNALLRQNSYGLSHPMGYEFSSFIFQASSAKSPEFAATRTKFELYGEAVFNSTCQATSEAIADGQFVARFAK
jgi:hypothetical protein